MSEIHIQNVDESTINTILGEDIDFTGTLRFSDSLMIKGRMKGDIRAAGDLYIDEHADVEAQVAANIVSLKGRVKGNVYATTRVELFSSAKVEGDITAPDVIMESGCRFNGICKMQSPDISLDPETEINET
ncbi:MAG: polymer-forming cytoskeletal protein [Spirochaetales bacterium]|nr:polymer-forming cytoskeletal protein [Spirochaetales bacterium]